MKRNPKIPLASPLAVVVSNEQSFRWPSDVWIHIVLVDPRALLRPGSGLSYYQRIPPGIVGYMVVEPERNRVRRVSRSVARKGYGPTLYEIALDQAREDGWFLAPGDEVSPAAREVWRRFEARYPSDIELEVLDEPDHDESYLAHGASLSEPLAGLGAAMERGQQLVERLSVEDGLAPAAAVKALVASGERLWMNRIEEERARKYA